MHIHSRRLPSRAQWLQVLAAAWLFLPASCQKVERTAPSTPTDGGGAGSAGPGPNGPFVEPPPGEPPPVLFTVVSRPWPDLAAASSALVALQEAPALTAGYPAVDQAGAFHDGAQGFVLVAGKFARRPFADGLLAALGPAGNSLQVVERPSRHDRLAPALNGLDGPRSGRVFSGVAGVDVPLLAGAGRESGGGGRVVPDGTLVEVLASQETPEGRFWKVRAGSGEGFLPGNRLLVEYNAFPSPDGRHAILGVPVGCRPQACFWDYWLIGKGRQPRQLLSPGASALPFSFSEDNRGVAYAAADGRLVLVEIERGAVVGAMDGTSPTFVGARVFFRHNGVGGARDEVMTAEPPEWTPHLVLDLPGEPHYPAALHLIPPAIEPWGRNFIGKFYRRFPRDGGETTSVITVLFDDQGKILDRRNEPL